MTPDASNSLWTLARMFLILLPDLYNSEFSNSAAVQLIPKNKRLGDLSCFGFHLTPVKHLYLMIKHYISCRT